MRWKASLASSSLPSFLPYRSTHTSIVTPSSNVTATQGTITTRILIFEYQISIVGLVNDHNREPCLLSSHSHCLILSGGGGGGGVNREDRTESPRPRVDEYVDVLVVEHARVGEGECEVALDPEIVRETHGEY